MVRSWKNNFPIYKVFGWHFLLIDKALGYNTDFCQRTKTWESEINFSSEKIWVVAGISLTAETTKDPAKTAA